MRREERDEGEGEDEDEEEEECLVFFLRFQASRFGLPIHHLSAPPPLSFTPCFFFIMSFLPHLCGVSLGLGSLLRPARLVSVVGGGVVGPFPRQLLLQLRPAPPSPPARLELGARRGLPIAQLGDQGLELLGVVEGLGRLALGRRLLLRGRGLGAVQLPRELGVAAVGLRRQPVRFFFCHEGLRGLAFRLVVRRRLPQRRLELHELGLQLPRARLEGLVGDAQLRSLVGLAGHVPLQPVLHVAVLRLQRREELRRARERERDRIKGCEY